MTLNCVAIVVFFIHRRALHQTVRRLNVLLNISYVIGPGSDALLAPYSFAKTNIACFSDGTMQRGHPDALCSFVAGKYIFGVFLMSFFAVNMCVEWLRLIRMLDLKKLAGFAKEEKWRERAYIGTTIVFSCVFVVLPLVRDTFHGSPSSGSCLLTTTDTFYIITVPFFAFAVVTGSFLCCGLPTLFRMYKGVRGFAKQIRTQLRGVPGNTHSRSRRAVSVGGLENLITLLLFYIAAVFGSFVMVAPIFSYMFASSKTIEKETEEHLKCRTTSCQPDLCPPLPTLDISLVLIPEVYVHLLGMVVCVWLLSWKSFKRRQSSLTSISSSQASRSAMLRSVSSCYLSKASSDSMPDVFVNIAAAVTVNVSSNAHPEKVAEEVKCEVI